MFSPTGYYAHYWTQFRDADGSALDTTKEIYPVVGYTDTALVIDGDGAVKTVGALLAELREGADRDEDGDGVTWKVTLEVSRDPE
jgi:hypothetical protein